MESKRVFFVANNPAFVAKPKPYLISSPKKEDESHLDVSKNRGKTPQIIPFVHRVWNHYFHHPFWGVKSPYFWKHPYVFCDLFQAPQNRHFCLSFYMLPFRKMASLQQPKSATFFSPFNLGRLNPWGSAFVSSSPSVCWALLEGARERWPKWRKGNGSRKWEEFTKSVLF